MRSCRRIRQPTFGRRPVAVVFADDGVDNTAPNSQPRSVPRSTVRIGSFIGRDGGRQRGDDEDEDKDTNDMSDAGPRDVDVISSSEGHHDDIVDSVERDDETRVRRELDGPDARRCRADVGV